jgi:hypothetical protein
MRGATHAALVGLAGGTARARAHLLRLIERRLERRLRREQLRDTLERRRALLRRADQVGLGLLEPRVPAAHCALLLLLEQHHLREEARVGRSASACER